MMAVSTHVVFNSLQQAQSALSAVNAALGHPKSVRVGIGGTRRVGRGPEFVQSDGLSPICVSPSGDKWSFIISQETWDSLPGASMGLPAPTERTEYWQVVGEGES